MKKHYKVVTPHHNWVKKIMLPFIFIRQFFFLLANLKKSKAVFIMFGGYWSYLPALMGKWFKTPVFIILGGTDCVSFPSINYGSYRKVFLKRFIKWSYKLCTELIPVHESLVISNNIYFDSDKFPKQGYLHFFPKINTSYRVIYNGFDTKYWKSALKQKRTNSFVTVAPISSLQRFKLKGVDVIFELARKFSNCSFTIIGMSDDLKSSLIEIPENVIIYGFLNSDDFKEILAEHEFYLQLSLTEGFPNSLCEGMLCECIPVGSHVGAIPYIISDTGFVLKKYDLNLIKNEFSKIFNLSDIERKKLAINARERIINNFDISRREEAFIELIKEYSA
ncbi:MAG: glycosyltransferase family 4 protein [Bacteroidota bacterium]